MTAEEFKAHFKEKHRNEDEYTYSRVTSAIVAGLTFFLFLVYMKDSIELFFIPLYLISIAFFTLWLLRKRKVAYQEIKSATAVQRKLEVLEGFAASLENGKLSMEDDIYFIDSIGKYAVSETYFYAHFDDEKILLRVSGPAPAGEILDFGHSRRMLKKIEAYFQQYL